MGLATGVVEIDSDDDFCWRRDLSFAIVVAKSAPSSYSGSGLLYSKLSVKIDGT